LALSYIKPEEVKTMAEKPDYASKAQDTFSAERKEDVFVLVVSSIVVVLVMLNVIGTSTVKSLFF